jgi:type I restriction-modification system DNA methylase subunit
MPTYTCTKCARVFKQKSGYDDHMNKKVDCIKNTVLDAVIETKVKQVIANQYKQEVTPETLPAFFEDLHNLLWNKAGLSPERALEHMTFFFAYRLIEQQADTLSLPQECRWSYLASQKDDDSTLATMRKGCVSFQKNSVTKPFFKKPEIDKAEIVHEIVQQINRIQLKTLQETDTLGDIFEYMLGRGMSTMSDEGQYFTNRAICKLAFKLAYDIKKNLRREDGTLCTFADWFCGTGGFPAEYIKGVKANLPSVDWNTDSGSIYCQDMNLSSVTTTLLNMLIITGIPFSGEKIRGSNSFYEPIITGSGAPFNNLTIDYCFMNPPYGGDKSKGKDYKFAYSKKVKGDGSTTKKFFVNQEIQSIGIEDDDKVSAGVQLAMATLADGGVCSIVLPQGFFFGASKKCVELRKKIAEEYKIHYIVDIASGAFKNTGTKTSMMVFQKGVGATDNIEFISLIMKESNSVTDHEVKSIIKTTLEELRSKHYSLNYKQYLPQSAVEVEGFDMVKLGDIIVADSGDLLAKNSIVKGEYPIIGGGKVVGYHNKTNRNPEEIVISRVGNACLTFMSAKYYLTDNALAIVSKDPNKMLIKYLYFYLTQNIDKLREKYSGTAQPVISKTRLYEIQIPLPSFERQQQIVESIDGWSSLALQEEQSLKILEKQMIFRVKEIGRGHTRVKLGNILKAVKGKRYPVGEGKDSGKYPLLRSSKDGKVKWMDDYTYEGPYITVGNGGEANFRLVNKFNASTHTLVYDVEETIIKEFAYYTIQSMRDTISEMCFQGTGLENLNTNLFMDIEIPLPPLIEQQMLQSDFDEIQHKHAKIATYKEKAQDAIQHLIPS